MKVQFCWLFLENMITSLECKQIQVNKIKQLLTKQSFDFINFVLDGSHGLMALFFQFLTAINPFFLGFFIHLAFGMADRQLPGRLPE